MSRELPPAKNVGKVYATFECPDGHVNEVVRTHSYYHYNHIPQTEPCYTPKCKLMSTLTGVRIEKK